MEALEKGTALSVYPNPATTAVTFAYRMDAIVEQAYVQVVDASGRQVARIIIPAQQGQVAWDPRGLAAGSYQEELRNGGKLLQSTTLLVP